jgi:FkbH-like protein
MKVKVISDVSLQLILTNLTKNVENINFDFEYTENMPISIRKLTFGNRGDYEFVWIHSDNIFHKNNIDYQLEILDAVYEYSNQSSNIILLSNSFNSNFLNSEIKKQINEFVDFWSNYGFEKRSKLLNSKNIYIIDILKLIFDIGLFNFYEYNLGHLYQMPYTKAGIEAITRKVEDTIRFLKSEEKKVIIVDCDNTLWNGIVGEDGIENIYCDKTEKGIIHFEFQKFLKQKLQDGFLICISSKNNFNDVKEVFDKKNMPLKFEDFIKVKIDWRNKIEHIKELSQELNLGIESFIFIDDSEFEINLVKSYYPEISAIKFPKSYKEFICMLDRNEFKKKFILEEDKNKFQQYVSELRREELKQNVKDFDQYIKALNIKMDVKINDITHIDRLSQLTEKTNQFNFNKVKFSPLELKEMIESNNWLIYSLRVSDIYGDYGIVGLIIIELLHNEKKAILENYILSCRALGRKIEYDFFDSVINDLYSKGYKITEIKFKETEKNKPAQTFYINYARSKI